MTDINYLHPFWTAARADAFWPVIKAQAHGRDAIKAAYAAIDPDLKIDFARTLAEGKLPMIATSAFVVPVLSEAGCKAILERSASYPWAENVEGEEEPVRIPEAVLAEVDPDYDKLISSVLMTGLSPWMAMIWGRLPSQISSLQLAHYNPEERAGGNWHVDRDSTHTAVISLNPGEFEGGGTLLQDGLFGDYYVPPLPQGYALIFDGRRVPHQGLPVVGNRKLLVLWSHQDSDNW